MNDKYISGVMKKYGNTVSGAEDKSGRFKSDFTFDELVEGTKVKYAMMKTVSTVIEKTSNTIKTLDLADIKNVDESGKRKGIDSYNWHTLEEFNRTFQRIKNK